MPYLYKNLENLYIGEALAHIRL